MKNIIRIVSLLLALLTLICTMPTLAEEELIPGVTMHWFERELYQSGFDEFELRLESRLDEDTKDYSLWLFARTTVACFSMRLDDGALVGIQDGYILFAPEWAEDFMSEIHSWQQVEQPAN